MSDTGVNTDPMTPRKVTEEEVYAECRKVDRDFPMGWSLAEAMEQLHRARKELEKGRKLDG